MKTSRNDKINSTVNHYLKRRQYMDATDVGDEKSRSNICNTKELTMKCAVLSNTSTASVISYSSITGDATVYDQQYCRLKTFILDSKEPHRTELSQLLCPIFVHMFLELICNGQKIAAQKFYLRHHGLFVDDEAAKCILSSIVLLASKEELLANKQATEFRQCKYGITVCEGTFNHLMEYLNHEDSVNLLQIASQHLDINVSAARLKVAAVEIGYKFYDPEVMKVDPHEHQPAFENLAPSPPGPTDPTIPSNDLSSLQRIIKKIEDDLPLLPSICLYSLRNTYQGVSSVCLSPDEQMLCAGFEDSSLTLWGLTQEPFASQSDKVCSNIDQTPVAGDDPEDVFTRIRASRKQQQGLYLDSGLVKQIGDSAESMTLRGHDGPVYGVHFIHDSQWLLSASADKTVRLWDTKSRANVVCYRGHNYPVFGVDMSCLGSMFASCSYDLTAKLWSTDRVYPLRTYIGHTQGVNCVQFHSNGTYMATGSSDMTIRLWDTLEGNPRRLLHGHRGMVMAVAFSPDGTYLASSGEDRHVRIWDLRTCGVLKDLTGHTDVVYSLQFNMNGSILASGGLDCAVRLWDVKKADTSGAEEDSSSSLGVYPTNSASVLYMQLSKKNFLQAVGS